MEKRKSAFRRSELVGPRIKGYIFDEGYTSTVGILHTLVYFYPKGLFVKYGNATCFDPMHWLNVSTDFRLGNRGNLDSGPS